MAISSINTNIAAQFAQQNIANASANAQSSVSRLSSGNRIVQASDDVAALSIGTSLQSQVSALKTALTNASQGTSLLQVADGALAQIQTILQQQKSIALQAGSGSLTDTDRGFLNQQFQALSSQINNLTTSTTFNGVGLIDGSLSQNVKVGSDVSTADSSSISVSFTTLAASETVVFGTGAGAVTFTATAAIGTAATTQVQFVTGASTAASVQNLADTLNGLNNSALPAGGLTTAQKQFVTSYTFEAQGTNLVVRARAGGDISKFVVDTTAGNNGTSGATVNGAGTQSISTATTDVSTIDADATAAALAKEFAAGALTYDGTTVATIVAGDSLRTIASKINGSTASTGVSAYITGTSGAYALTLASLNNAATGTIAGAGLGSATAAAATATNAIATSVIGDNNTGLGFGSVIGQGSTGGATSILTDQTQLAAKSVISFPDIANGDLLTSTNFGGTAKTIAIAGVTFTFTTTAQGSTSATEIGVGSTLTETLDNAVAKINSYAGLASADYQFNQIQARREGNSIVVESRIAGDATDLATAGVTVASASAVTGSSVSQANLKNTNNGGIDTRGINNANFIGSISGFQATFSSANTVSLSVNVGGRTYSGQNLATNPTALSQSIRLISAEGDYFDLNLRSGGGEVVSSQADADRYAQRLDNAASGVTFYQNRDISSFKDTGVLTGSSVSLSSDNFTNTTLSGVNVNAPTGSSTNGSISFSIINGDGSTETFTSQTPLGSQLGSNSVTKFVSDTDANKVITFRNGATALDFSTATTANTLQTALRNAFGVGSGSGALSFQVGTTAASTVKVNISAASTSNIFGGQTLSVATSADAANAATVLDSAISTVTSIRANVGALQTQFNFASAALQSGVQNQDAARSQFLDTDIAAESTSYATSQVKLQAGISVLAQANQQLQALLKLIG